MKRAIYVLLICVLVSCTEKDNEEVEITPDIIPIEMQTDIIAKLCGKTAIEEGYTLESRSEEVDKIKVRSYLKKLIRRLSLKELEHYYITPNLEEGINIYTTLYATTTTDEFVIIGAHYDAVPGSPGAIDNATGVAAVYELMKKLKTVEVRNKNIMFVYFDDEEIGIYGSDEFAKKIKEDSMNVHSVHTIDMVGWDSDGDRAIEIELPTDYLKEKYETAGAVNNIPIYITTSCSTDFITFKVLGFNAVGIAEEYVNGDTTPHMHTSEDTYETVNFEYLSSTTGLIYSVIEDIVTEE